MVWDRRQLEFGSAPEEWCGKGHSTATHQPIVIIGITKVAAGQRDSSVVFLPYSARRGLHRGCGAGGLEPSLASRQPKAEETAKLTRRW